MERWEFLVLLDSEKSADGMENSQLLLCHNTCSTHIWGIVKWHITYLNLIFGHALGAMLYLESTDSVPHISSSTQSWGYHSKLMQTLSERFASPFGPGALAEIAKCQHHKRDTLNCTRSITQHDTKQLVYGWDQIGTKQIDGMTGTQQSTSQKIACGLRDTQEYIRAMKKAWCIVQLVGHKQFSQQVSSFGSLKTLTRTHIVSIDSSKHSSYWGNTDCQYPCTIHALREYVWTIRHLGMFVLLRFYFG